MSTAAPGRQGPPPTPGSGLEVEALFENLPGTSMWLAEVGYDPETVTVRLSPTWSPTARPLGFAPEPMLGLEFRAARSRLFPDGMEHVSARG